jgi:hypothetical protein
MVNLAELSVQPDMELNDRMFPERGIKSKYGPV